MTLLTLFWVFFKIGASSFGGGYAMIPIIGKEIEAYGWIQPQEYANLISISQMTPGPIAVNTATYVGIQVAGIPGALIATLGVSLPAFILIIMIAKFLMKFSEFRFVDAALRGIRPATIGLISSAVVFMADTSIITSTLSLEKLCSILTSGSSVSLIESLDLHWGALLIFGIILLGIKKFRLHPIAAIFVSAGLGLLFL